MGVLDNPEALLLLGLCRLVVQREMHHYPLRSFRCIISRHGAPCVPRQTVGVRLTVRSVQHHGPAVGHATGAGQVLRLSKREERNQE